MPQQLPIQQTVCRGPCRASGDELKKKNMVHWKRKMLLDSPPPKPSARCMSWSPQAPGAALYFFWNNALMRPPKRPLMVAPLCLDGAATGTAVGCASTVTWGTSSLTGTWDVVHVFL